MKRQPVPDCVVAGTQPLALYRTQIKMLCKMFDENGWSSHSIQGGTLWAIIEHCKLERIPYEVWQHDFGYAVSKPGRERRPPGFRLIQSCYNF